MGKELGTSQDELLAALFYLYQEALKKDARLAQAIQVAIETCEKIGPAGPQSESRQDILKQFYVLREFKKMDDSQKQLFIQEIDCIQTKTQKGTRKAVKKGAGKNALRG